jgi:hypothetical protein
VWGLAVAVTAVNVRTVWGLAVAVTAVNVRTVWGLAVAVTVVNVRTECGNSGQGRGGRVIKNISTESKFRTKMGYGNEENFIIERTQDRQMTRRRGM